MSARGALGEQACANARKDNDSDAQSAFKRDGIPPNKCADDRRKNNAGKREHGAHKQVACAEAARHGDLSKARRQSHGNDAGRAFDRIGIGGLKEQVPDEAKDKVEKGKVKDDAPLGFLEFAQLFDLNIGNG